ncbi:DUF5723 family protein [Belliella marina]|uniref:DUF5723 family protein n=1 Tax=Belliella marina TaxID=1644146 RepID=A0ABW4VR90_9BACT
MKQFYLTYLLTILSLSAIAQQSFVGIQNTSRRGVLHAVMNPAEVANLSKNVDVNLFSVSAGVGNDVLFFNEIIGEEDIADLLFDRVDNAPVNLNAELNFLGPSFAFKAGKWGFGIYSQVVANVGVMDLNSELGRAFTDFDVAGSRELRIQSPTNQRVNVVGWGEIGGTVGRKIYSNGQHEVSAGVAVRLLMPVAYVNAGIADLDGTIQIDENEGVALTDATGVLNLSYSPSAIDEDLYGLGLDNLSPANMSGLGFDLGLSHVYYVEGVAKAHSGISLKGLGSLDFGDSQMSSTLTMNIPSNNSFRLDELEGDIDEIEEQLLASGYFSKVTESGHIARLPKLLTAYTDVRVTKVFYLSLFGQWGLSGRNDNQQIASQNIFAVTPRLKLGGFELYSPWARYQVSGFTGGLGLRFGGFFVGSNSAITGLLAETKQADVHLGLNLGFGKSKRKSTTEIPGF